jgi:hypothetical protein
MSDTSDLLDVARLLSTPGAQPRSTDAELRRAVSSVYYAVFHKILRAAAQRFVGPDHEETAAYGILYRAFDRRHVAMVCEALRGPTLRDKYKLQLRRTAVSQDMRDFAGIFPVLQDARHLADYDPAARFRPSNVSSLIDEADTAMAAFDRVTPEEQADVLALMMVRTRD